MGMVITVTIVTPVKKVFSGQASSVRVPAGDGYMEFKFRHAPLVTNLGVGVLKVCLLSHACRFFYIEGGYAEIHENELLILADQAENGENINIREAINSRDAAERRMLDPRRNTWEIEKARADFQRAENRIKTHYLSGEGRDFNR